jgi:hypothetical protein
MRTICFTALALTCALPVTAADTAPAVPVSIHVAFDGVDPGPIRLPRVDFTAAAPAAHLDLASAVRDAAQTARPPRAFVYSEGYQTRDKIHHMASYTLLPLFAAEAYLGQHMFNHPGNITPAMQTAHRAMGWGVAGLFGVNTVTGLWNLAEARKDPNGLGRRMIRRRRRVHGDGVHAPEQHDGRRSGDLHGQEEPAHDARLCVGERRDRRLPDHALPLRAKMSA